MTQSAKYCDLVMKGGITSGIVYPNAVLAIAREYRFKSIGGTSAGAIAAAVCAAAAYGDRRQTLGAAGASGFQGLNGVANQLATEGFIYRLFQPAKGARHAFDLVVTLAGNARIARKILALLIAVFLIAPVETLMSLAALLGVGAKIAGFAGVEAALLPALLCAYAAGAAFAILRVARVARRNLLGLCTGRSRDPQGKAPDPGLTDWLHAVIQSLSGLGPNEPLTFGHLWTAPRYEGEPETPNAIVLQMITTDISHHEPRTLPMAGSRFWFRRDQFDLLFPAEVVDWMVNLNPNPTIVDNINSTSFPAMRSYPSSLPRA